MRCKYGGLLLIFVLLLGGVGSCSNPNDATTREERKAAAPETGESGLDKDGDLKMAKQAEHGFKEYVKNPGLFRAEVKAMRRGEDVPPPTQKELVAIVSTMGKRRLQHEELQKLKMAGRKAVPFLREALQDKKVLFHRYGTSVLDGSPIETALDLLEPFAEPETGLLEPALRHSDVFFRYHALYHLARCGKDDSLDALKAGLKADAVECRTWTLMGLGFLKDSSRGSRKFRAAMFEATVPLLRDKEHDPAEHAARALLVLDVDRAKAVLTGKEFFRPDNERISDVLQALKDENISVSGRQLRDLLSGMKSKAARFPFDWAYADGLVLLARVEGARSRELIADAQSWGNERVKIGAARAAEIAADVRDAYSFVNNLYERKGVKALQEPQLHYLTLWWLDAEVNNGGFSQYFFNSSGDLASHAVKAAKGVGAPKVAAIIQKAIALFGVRGPDPDREKRMDQLSEIDLRTLEKLDEQYYQCSERLSEILPRFVAANPEFFKPAK